VADVNDVVELFGARCCPYTAEVREHLIWHGTRFTEYDVETDSPARARLVELTGTAVVPVLVENGLVREVGWRGRSCAIARRDGA